MRPDKFDEEVGEHKHMKYQKNRMKSSIQKESFGNNSPIHCPFIHELPTEFKSTTKVGFGVAK